MFLLSKITGAQCSTGENIIISLGNIDTDSTLSIVQKLKKAYHLKELYVQCGLAHDSTYANLLHKLGIYEFRNNNFQSAIENTEEAAKVNSSGSKGSVMQLAIKSYYNLGYYYQKLLLFNKALTYYDSAILIANKFPDKTLFILNSRVNRAYIYFLQGDYQKGVEESDLGINIAVRKNDSTYYLAFLNQKAQSLFFQNQFANALSNAEKIITMAQIQKDNYQLASGYKIKAMILAKNRQFEAAESSFKKAISTRVLSGDATGQIAGDLNDMGGFYLDSLHNYKKARDCYLKALDFATAIKDSLKISRIYANLGLTSYSENSLSEAGLYYIKSLSFLKVVTGNSILQNATARQLTVISQKGLIFEIITNKTNLLLKQYVESGDKAFLKACLESALLSDTLITQMRHEQLGEESKLYWRERTREFFTTALEACYIAGNVELAFFFMEKSRSVLLNDEINELGAFAYLPANESAMEQRLHFAIIKEQEELNTLSDSSKEYNIQQAKLLEAKDRFEQFTKQIEKQYPTYYQYKYSDEVTKLGNLRKYLSENTQSFVHYFMNDTVTYVLAVSGAGSKFIKLSRDAFNSQLAEKYLKFCSDKNSLNQRYKDFVSLSNTLYQQLFQPLQLSKGRVIICPDNFLLPFESLCPDKTGENFLADNYIFSYVYSARYLLNKNTRSKAIGDFIGFAPVSFEKRLGMPDLKQSATSLEHISTYYHSPRVFMEKNANRQTFMNMVSGYSIVNVYSHASAETNNNEPMLYMADSTIPLSQLQLLHNPAIRLVVLSACETSVGKNATGEGIYSLARGFAAAGVPSIAATLWKTDEQAVYTVSEKFHENISKGMRLDEALQKAKLYLRKNGNLYLLPYFWANMVLLGNAEPVNIKSGQPLFPWILTILIVAGIIAFVVVKKRRRFSEL